MQEPGDRRDRPKVFLGDVLDVDLDPELGLDRQHQLEESRAVYAQVVPQVRRRMQLRRSQR